MAKFHTESGKLADPEFRRERARKAAHAAHTVDARIDALIRLAPVPTPEQAAKLRAWLPAPAESASTDDLPPSADERE